jgi:hypothetical protein
MNSEGSLYYCTSRTLAEYSCRRVTPAGPPASRALQKVSYAALRLNISGWMGRVRRTSPTPPSQEWHGVARLVVYMCVCKHGVARLVVYMRVCKGYY